MLRDLPLLHRGRGAKGMNVVVVIPHTLLTECIDEPGGQLTGFWHFEVVEGDRSDVASEGSEAAWQQDRLP